MSRDYLNLFAAMMLAILFGVAQIASAQVSVEEAQHRLEQKLATRPTTQPAVPAAEVERLRAENLRLRERVMNLEQEVTTLKGALARASAAATPATGPTTHPSAQANAASPQSLVGSWRGGDATAGTSFLLTFKADGSYDQYFPARDSHEKGQYRAFDDGVIEMWNEKWPDTKMHNQYRYKATAVQLTLTPMLVDGVEVTKPKGMVMNKAE